MPRRRALVAAAGGAACAVAFALLWLLALRQPAGRHVDAVVLHGFTEVHRGRLIPVLQTFAHVGDPLPFTLIGAALVLLALARRRPRVALAIVLVLVGSNVTTQGLKQLLEQVRFQ